MSVSNLIDSIGSGQATDVIVFLGLGIIAISFVVLLFLKIYGLIKREIAKYYVGIFVGISATILMAGVISFFPSLKEGVFLGFFSAGIGLVFYSILMILPDKERKIREEQKELVRLIDKEIQKGQISNIPDKIIPKQLTSFTKNKDNESIRKISVNTKEESEEAKRELDYSHVRNILSRLDFFSLNSTERKQVDTLKSNLSRSEKGDSTLKSEINDGLGALLKIMSKYSV